MFETRMGKEQEVNSVIETPRGGHVVRVTLLPIDLRGVPGGSC